MPLNQLSLTIASGRPGRHFEANVVGLTTGRVELGSDGTPGFNYVNGRVVHPNFPGNLVVATVVLIETDPGATVSRRESRIEVTPTTVSELNRLRVDIPAAISGAGSAPITGSSGGTITVAVNPDSAWSVSGTTLSWSSAAIGKAGRPVLVEAASQSVPLARQTSFGGAVAAAAPTPTPTPTPTPSAMMARLKRANTAAQTLNSEDAPANSTGITFTMEGAADASLTQIYTGAVGAPLRIQDATRVTGGKPTLTEDGTNRIVFPVASIAPAGTGSNLAVTLPSTPSYNAWGFEDEFVTGAPKVQFRFVGNPVSGLRISVDGRFVSKSALNYIVTNSQNYPTITFTDGQSHVIRLHGAGGSSQMVSIAVAPGFTVARVASPPEGALVLCTGDSYSEGTGASIPGLFAWTKILGRKMGWTDVRQVAVGSTGYLSNGGGNRKTLRGQIADWGVVNSDISMDDVAAVTVAGGYNDYSQPNMATLLQPEVLATLQAIRTKCPNAVIFVYGSHTGARGPDATTIQVENLIKAAFNQWGDANSYFIPIATASPPWITGTGYAGATNGSGTSDTLISADGSHPNDAGHAVIADKATTATRAIVVAA